MRTVTVHSGTHPQRRGPVLILLFQTGEVPEDDSESFVCDLFLGGRR